MKERPILFSGAMVRALLDGSKTQTQRVVKPQPEVSAQGSLMGEWLRKPLDGLILPKLQDITIHCPYGMPGDRLYVRETWQHSNHPFGPYEPDCDVFYRADYLDDPLGADLERSADGIRRQWRPSIHMPRAASRITLEVAGVRVERLQGVSEADAIAEGIYLFPGEGGGYKVERGEQEYDTAREDYRNLWDSLNAERGYGWDANPYVWVVEFKKIEVK
jgi:hypothetical protein